MDVKTMFLNDNLEEEVYMIQPKGFMSKESLDKNAVVAGKKPYIVYLGAHSHGPQATVEDYARATDSHYELLGSLLGRYLREKAGETIFYSYNKHINGFAATLEEEEATLIREHPGVLSVFESINYELQTTRSWAFLHVEGDDGSVSNSSIWTAAKYGSDSIIANIDSGVWPESASFKDDGFGDVPTRWKGECQKDPTDGVTCNKKLIGAKSFYHGFEAANNVTLNVTSPRDHNGHGTHTLSTAAGNFVPDVEVLGNAKGTAKGGSSHARVAAYKVCWNLCDEPNAPPTASCSGQCNGADLLAAFDAAIQDGVDVISVSLGGGAGSVDYFSDSSAIGAFHAVAKGITVACSAGNSGPFLLGAVNNAAPWVITVAASTIDRDFKQTITSTNNKQIQGRSFTLKSLDTGKKYTLIRAVDVIAANASEDDATLCEPHSIDAAKVEGKIVLCQRGPPPPLLDDFPQVPGAAGTIVIDNNKRGDNFLMTAFMDQAHLLISEKDGQALQSNIRDSKSNDLSISGPTTELKTGRQAPAVAYFSSPGPNYHNPLITKPDVAAPGVNILAAYSQAPKKDKDFLNPSVPYHLLSGTSMACPHVAGVVGLLKTLHPDWSPAAIKSAILTTATILDDAGNPIKNFMGSQTDPWRFGAGNIQPNSAMDPGLVYDLKPTDFLDLLCSMGYNSTQLAHFTDPPYACPKQKIEEHNLNYPMIAIRYPTTTATATRTVKNVGPPGTYKVQVTQPVGITLSVTPSILEFKSVGEEKTYTVEAKPNKPNQKPINVLGYITWSDGTRNVRSNIIVLDRW
ncbi:subtilisin-like protease SBT5.3 [Musa acuminata AAA Group]|uniref:subtilisin-like protease SBT5.3 n=1 Tax=Musa acuminata AAA Group TaxID=214697 RepID=UPI0031DCB2E3